MFLPYAVLLFSCPLLVSSLSPPIPDKCVEGDYRLGDQYVVEVCRKYAVDGNHKEWTNVKACLTPRKTRIPIGKSVSENGIKYSCVKNGHKAKLVKKEDMAKPLRSKRSSENLLCKGQYKNGERFASGNFIKECKSTPASWSIVIVACVTPGKKEIAIGSTANEEGLQYSCIKTDNGAQIQTAPCPTEPKGNTGENQLCDGKYKNEERFTSGNFIKECKSTTTSWSIVIVACVTQGKKEIAIGSSAIEEGFEYKCIKTENGAKIETTPCPTENKANATGENQLCDGKYKNEERFNSGNFIKECKSTTTTWSIVIVACVTPGKKEIAIGSSAIEEGFEYKCIKTENGARIETTPCPTENKANATGENQLCDGKYKNEERFNSGNFIKECKSTTTTWSIVIVACVTPGKKEIAIGSSAIEEGFEYKCIKTENGARIETTPCPTEIKGNTGENQLCDGKYKNGDRFTSGNFIKECKSTPTTWSIVIVACVSPGKKEIAIGSSAIEEGFEYKCIKTENGARIETTPCPTEPKGNTGENQLCDGKYKNEERFTSGNFIKECKSSLTTWSIVIVACVTPGKKEIAIGSFAIENDRKFSCIKTENGARIETTPCPTENKENMLCDGQYKNGEKITSGNFVKQCTSTPTSWSIEIVACLTPEKKEILLGESAVEGEIKYSCIKTEAGATMKREHETFG